MFFLEEKSSLNEKRYRCFLILKPVLKIKICKCRKKVLKIEDLMSPKSKISLSEKLPSKKIGKAANAALCFAVLWFDTQCA